MAYTLTLDRNVSDNAKDGSPMSTLKRWQSEGKLKLVEAVGSGKPPAYGWPGAPPKPAEPSRGRRIKKATPSADFRAVAAVVHPGKDSQKLNMSEVNDVAHLAQHLSNKNEIFVTSNLVTFIENGRRDRLRTALGIVVMTPEETVRSLIEMEGWK